MNKIKKECRNMQLLEKTCVNHGGDLRRFIYALTREDLFAMEEIYQNTMLGALKGLNFLRDSSKMKPWIFSIAKAESKRYYAAITPERCCSCMAAVCEDCFGSEYKLDFTKSVEDQEYVRNLIDGLSCEEQQLYVLHYFYDLPLKEISEILKVNYNTIRSMHTRGMAKMRRRLSKDV